MGRKRVVYEVIEENPGMGCLGFSILLILAHFIVLHFTGFSILRFIMSMVRKVISFI